MDKDIKEMFREKNKEIIINNLKYDLEKNTDNFLDTITNIFNLEFNTAIKNIISICEDSNIFNSDKIITDAINNMKLNSYNNIDKYFNIKKNNLEEKIDNLEFDSDSLNKYYNYVFKTTKEFKNNLSKYCINEIKVKGIDTINKFILSNVDSLKEELTISRVTDYIDNRLYGKLETKVHMEIMIRDNNLINKAKESYLRYKDISNRTTNI